MKNPVTAVHLIEELFRFGGFDTGLFRYLSPDKYRIVPWFLGKIGDRFEALRALNPDTSASFFNPAGPRPHAPPPYEILPPARAACRAMDVFTQLRPIREEFAQTIVEALSFGLPIIGMHVGGSPKPSVRREDRAGWLLPPQDNERWWRP